MTPRSRLRTWRSSPFAIGCFAAAAVLLTWGLWRDPNGRMLRYNFQDQVLLEWVLAHAAQTVVHLRNPFFTEWVNAPFGINMMANVSVWAAALPLTPVTLALGPGVAFAALVTLSIAGTASAWYLVLRRLLKARAAAFLGAACCGFGPGLIAQATGHPHIASQILLPFIVLYVLRLREPGPVVKPALALSALIVCQVFLGEEILLLTALALGLFALLYAGMRPAELRGALRRGLAVLGLTAAVSGAILAYPLYYQFAGPQSYSHLPEELVHAYGADLASYVAYATESIAGSEASAGPLAKGVPEQNAFFGWPLVVLLAFVGLWLRREPVARALIGTALVAATMSLGTHIVINGKDTGLPGPWLLPSRFPLAGSILPTRFALVAWTASALLLALFVDRALAAEGANAVMIGAPARPRTEADGPRTGTRAASAPAGVTPRWLVAAALTAALVPLAPNPLSTIDARDAPAIFAGARSHPHFFSSGKWRRVVPPGGSILILPTGWLTHLNAMYWQTRAGVGFKIFGGYFLIPEDGIRGNPSQLGPPPSHTRAVFDADGLWKRQPASEKQIAAAREEIRTWRIDAAVLPLSHPAADAILTEAQRVFGPGRQLDNVWFWDLKAIR